MKLLRSLSAGILDSGLASLATFAIGIYAARYLDVAGMGVFALHFAAFTLVSTGSHQGVFIPMEAAAARSPSGIRFLKRSLLLAWVPLVAAPVVALLPVLAAPSSRSVAMGLTAAAAVALSPVQDHIRRMLHLGGRSSGAAGASAVQLGTVTLALWLLHGRVTAEAVPFGALALANGASLLVGFVAAGPRMRARSAPDRLEPTPPGLRELLAAGKWLFSAQMMSAAATFVAASLLGRLASIEALGMADAARIVARPVLVLTTGMTAVLGPRLMTAAAEAAEGRGREIGGIYRRVVASGVIVYLAAFGWTHPLNPLLALVPMAYALPWLVAATVVANGLTGVILPPRFEVIGAGRARELLRVDVWAGMAQVAVACGSAALHAFALPASHAAFALFRGRGLSAVRRRVYRVDPRASPLSGAGVPPALAADDEHSHAVGRPGDREVVCAH